MQPANHNFRGTIHLFYTSSRQLSACREIHILFSNLTFFNKLLVSHVNCKGCICSLNVRFILKLISFSDRPGVRCYNKCQKSFIRLANVIYPHSWSVSNFLFIFSAPNGKINDHVPVKLSAVKCKFSQTCMNLELYVIFISTKLTFFVVRTVMRLQVPNRVGLQALLRQRFESKY